MGALYTAAEVICTPFVSRMVEVLPDWRGLDVLAEVRWQQHNCNSNMA
jgi:hypothetical protein